MPREKLELVLMKISVILNRANRSWILQKIAENLCESLVSAGHIASVSEYPDSSADIIHHMSWAFSNIKVAQPSTMLITHLDDFHKVRQVKEMLASTVSVGVCMSSHTMHYLINQGVPEEKLFYISPAHDALLAPRRIVIGVTTRLYPDGRKRESLLKGLAERISLSAFEFRIFGEGWDAIVPVLEKAGAEVTYFRESDDYRKDYEIMLSEIPKFDFYLYLGLDEGSLGTLDALCAGVPTIVTPQGFHVDLPGGITHPVVTESDLVSVFSEIQSGPWMRRSAVSGLTWGSYASKHLALWQSLLTHGMPPALEYKENLHTVNLYIEREIARSTFANSFSMRRILANISHHPRLRKLREIVDKIRFGR